MYSNVRKKNNFARKSHAILKSCFQCSLVCTAAEKMILNIHTLIVFLHFTIRWWIPLSMPSLKTQFHTYLIRSSKQFLHFVIFSDACHQTQRKSASSNLYCLHLRHHTHSVRPPAFTGLYLLSNLLTLAQTDGCNARAPITKHFHMIY